ncbi:MAG: ACT domain-containing protein [Bacteroidales bacterium]|nr:ACT domain-containing protein [Bacteroidales bacterium]
MKKVIISVLGKDTVGIIAKVCNYLANENISIMDISQTIVQGYFNMMMIVEMTEAKISLLDLQKGMDIIGEQINVQIKCQGEEIFNKMHRI